MKRHRHKFRRWHWIPMDWGGLILARNCKGCPLVQVKGRHIRYADKPGRVSRPVEFR